MGHQRLSDPPTTKEWQEVVRRINANEEPAAVADAAIRAVQDALMRASDDHGVIEVIYLLCNVPFAARQPAFAVALAEYGVQVQNDPRLLELLASITEAIDERLWNTPYRSDMNEMAQAALIETFAKLGHERVNEGLFPNHAETVRHALLAFDTRNNFGLLAKHFFARFVFKCLDYFLSRTVPLIVGCDKRFANLDALREYMKRLEAHCFKAAETVAIYCGDWLRKERRQEESVTREGASEFAYGALWKLVETLMHTESNHA